ncbi:MAG TPA: class I SAM-dependent methyltransferase [Rubricoccaceae bacterium]|nr:class I SAM-dependent methyltransferase [Rubricoccaceae bacterium]
MITPRTGFEAASVARHYDELDVFYREVWGPHVHHGLWQRGDESVEEATEALALAVAEAAGIKSGPRVCDVGCGYGATARLLAERFGAYVTGLTLSEEQAAFARAQPVAEGAPRPEILVRDWLANGLPDRHFDAVIAIESSTHMPERARVFAEMHRVLRPGGRLVACLWMTEENPRPWAVRWLLEPICREGRLAGMGSAAENRAWAEAAGFEVERLEDWSKRVRRTWGVILRRMLIGLVREPRYRRYLRDAQFRERIFALTVPRIWAAYATGAMRYGFLVARRRGPNPFQNGGEDG